MRNPRLTRDQFVAETVAQIEESIERMTRLIVENDALLKRSRALSAEISRALELAKTR